MHSLQRHSSELRVARPAFVSGGDFSHDLHLIRMDRISVRLNRLLKAFLKVGVINVIEHFIAGCRYGVRFLI